MLKCSLFSFFLFFANSTLLSVFFQISNIPCTILKRRERKCLIDERKCLLDCVDLRLCMRRYRLRSHCCYMYFFKYCSCCCRRRLCIFIFVVVVVVVVVVTEACVDAGAASPRRGAPCLHLRELGHRLLGILLRTPWLTLPYLTCIWCLSYL